MMTRFVAGLAFAAALTLAASVTAQAPTPAAKTHKGHMATSQHKSDMMAECQAMMTKRQDMEEKAGAMDAKLDKLVAEMNAAGTDTRPDAMEKPMAAVINELVAQRKAMRSMMMEMQPEMMAHMMHHMHSHGTKGGMAMSDCPMMKTGEQEGSASHPKAQ